MSSSLCKRHMDRRLQAVELIFSGLYLGRSELAKDPLDIHQLLAVHRGELVGRHFSLVPLQDVSVREDARKMIREHDCVRARETHRWAVLAQSPRWAEG